MTDFRETGIETILEAATNESKRIIANSKYEKTTTLTSTHDFVFALDLINKPEERETFLDKSNNIFPIVQRINDASYILTASLLHLLSGRRDLAEQIEMEQERTFAVQGRPYAYPHFFRRRSTSYEREMAGWKSPDMELRDTPVRGNVQFNINETLYAAHINAALGNLEKARNIAAQLVTHTWDFERGYFHIYGDSMSNGQAATTFSVLRTFNILGFSDVGQYLSQVTKHLEDNERKDLDFSNNPCSFLESRALCRKVLFFDSFNMGEQANEVRNRLLTVIGEVKEDREISDKDKKSISGHHQANLYNRALVKAGIVLFGLPKNNLFELYIP